MIELDKFLTMVYLALGWQPYTWFALFALFNLLDAVTTVKALRMGGREINPAMARIMRVAGIVPALVLMKTAMLYLAWSSLQSVILYMPLLVGFYIAAVGWNMYQIRRLG